jgi:hypothetical protein
MKLTPVGKMFLLKQMVQKINFREQLQVVQPYQSAILIELIKQPTYLEHLTRVCRIGKVSFYTRTQRIMILLR